MNKKKGDKTKQKKKLSLGFMLRLVKSQPY